MNKIKKLILELIDEDIDTINVDWTDEDVVCVEVTYNYGLLDTYKISRKNWKFIEEE